MFNTVEQGIGLHHWTRYQSVVEAHEGLRWKVIRFDENGDPIEVEVQEILQDGSLVYYIPLHFLEGKWTAGFYINGEWVCVHCERQPIDVTQPNNRGYCDSYFGSEIRGVYCITVHIRHQHIFKPKHLRYGLAKIPRDQRGAYLCKNCGKKLFRNNTIGICRTNPECKKENQRLHDQARPKPKKKQAPVRLCESCGRAEIFKKNSLWLCQTNPECRRKYMRAYYKRIKQQKDQQDPPCLCEHCGKTLSRSNTTDICTTNPECMKEYRRARRALAKVQP